MTWKGGDSTHLDNDRWRTYEPSLHGQDSTKDRPATPALPRLPLLQPDICSGAKSGLTAYRQRVLMVAHQEQQDRPLRQRPSNARAGAKGIRTRLTPLRLHDGGGRGAAYGRQRALAEEEVWTIAPWH